MGGRDIAGGMIVIGGGGKLRLPQNATQNETITLTNGTLSPVDALSMFSNTTLNLNGTTANTAIDTDGKDWHFQKPVIGSGTALVKKGAGTLRLFGSNTYSGQTVVEAGTLAVTSNNGLGTAANGTLVKTGARLILEGPNYTTPEPVSLEGGGPVFTSFHANGFNTTFAGNIELVLNDTSIGSAPPFTLTGNIVNNGHHLTILAADDFFMQGSISGAGGLTKGDTGTLILRRSQFLRWRDDHQLRKFQGKR